MVARGGGTFIRTAGALAVALLASASGVYAGSWTDEHIAAGIDFFHPGDDDWLYHMQGSGACFVDFDADGFDDALLVNEPSENPDLNAEHDPRVRLYQNLGDGTFADVSATSGVVYRAIGRACAAGDYDGDGDLDAYLTGFGGNALFRNDGDFRFVNVTVAAGVETTDRCIEGFACFGSGAAWGDPDEDGCLDLYVVNFVRYNRDDQPFPSPDYFAGQENFFFQNRCDGTFEERGEALGLRDDPSDADDDSKSFQPIWADHDDDGRLDVFVTSDGTPDSLFRQKEDGTFEEVAVDAGVADPRAGMGLVFDDFDGDGLPDLYFTHYETQMNGFYINDGDGTFTDHSGEGNLSDDEPFVGWGAAFVDLDADGRRDLLSVNGHTFLDPELPGGFHGGPQHRLAYRHLGGFEFENVTFDLGPGFDDARSHARGLATADYDRNGVPDFLIVNTFEERAQLLRGDRVEGDGNWMWLSVQQSGPNRFAVGARIAVTPLDGPPATALVQAGGSFYSTDSYSRHFGLGSAASADVTVRFPDGVEQTWIGLAAGNAYRLVRDEVAAVADILGPLVASGFAGEAGVDGWFRSPVAVTLTATDRGIVEVSGVASLEYAVDRGAWTAWPGSLELTTGTRLLSLRAWDHAGNPSPIVTRFLGIDVEPPSALPSLAGPAGEEGWFVGSVEVRANAADGLSGVRRIEASLDGAPFATSSGVETVSEDGAHEVAFLVSDRAGNMGGPFSAQVLVDATPPVTDLRPGEPSLETGGRVYVTSATPLELDAVDAASGVRSSEYRIDDGPWEPYEGVFRLEGADGTHRVGFRSVDVAGNREGERVTDLFLDNLRPPPLVLRSPLPGLHGADQSVPFLPSSHEGVEAGGGWPAVVVDAFWLEADAGPDVSGVAWTEAELAGDRIAFAPGPHLEGRVDVRGVPPGFHTLVVRVSDGLGNVSETPQWLWVVPAPG